jgi:hypothetical protein
VLTKRLVWAIAHLSNLAIRGRERLYERIQIGLMQIAINVAVGLGVICSQQDRTGSGLHASRKPIIETVADQPADDRKVAVECHNLIKP